jgi:pimeloyl-ACP methyl ester carboxylesterase
MSQPTDYVFLHSGAQGSWVWADTIQALSTQTEGRFGRATDGLAPDEVAAERLCAQRLVRIDAGHQVMNTRPHALAEALRLEAESSPPPH